MSFLDRLFGAGKAESTADAELHCGHGALAPMWDSVQDMGHHDRVTRYRCLECGDFIPAEAAPAQAREHLAA